MSQRIKRFWKNIDKETKKDFLEVIARRIHLQARISWIPSMAFRTIICGKRCHFTNGRSQWIRKLLNEMIEEGRFTALTNYQEGLQTKTYNQYPPQTLLVQLN